MWVSCREGLPELRTARTLLRELRGSDAATLLPLLHEPEVRRYMAHAPRDLEAFGAFIEWTHRERQAGRRLCYGIVLQGTPHAVGLIQVWPIEPTGRTVEWGFALGRPYWGHAVFHEAALAVVDYITATLRVQRLEARAAVSNVRGNAALGRLGAVREGVLRQCFPVSGIPADYVMWSILAADWASTRAQPGSPSQEAAPSCRAL